MPALHGPATLRRRPQWVLAACLLTVGCLSNSRFEEVAPGVSVTRKSIDEFADHHGLSRSEAKRQIAAELTSAKDADPQAKAERALEIVTGREIDGHAAE